MAGNEKFWNRVANKYAKKAIDHEDTYRQKLQRASVLLSKSMRVVEVGCGTGGTARGLAPFVKSFHATDFSEKMIEIAKERAAKEKISNLQFECSDMTRTLRRYKAKANLDVVMAHSVLHLLEDRKKALREIYTALKPGGLFISTTACISDYFVLLRYIVPVCSRLGIFPMIKVFSAKQLRGEIKDAGFEIIQSWLPDKARGLFLIARKI